MKLVKVIKDKTYKAKDGKEYKAENYYLVHNDNWICIRPSFAKDYFKLGLLCEVIKNGKE